MPKDLDKYVDSLLTELRQQKNLTLFKSVIDFVISEHVNILKDNLEKKRDVSAITVTAYQKLANNYGR